jgi:2-polyprenyl-3-methyl-5-hydroxy-6-metoxy-1,4-benzoquinol methylase
MDDLVRQLCPHCASASTEFFQATDYNRAFPGRFPYHRCSSCGLVFIEAIPTNLPDYYAGGYQAKPHSLSELRSMAAPESYRLEPILQHRRRGKLLEVGPWIGLFSSNARDAGFDVSAIELDAGCVKLLRDLLGVRAIQSNDPAKTLAGLEEEFDVIALWHSIEHLPRPWEVIRQAARRLAPDGILLIAAPNPESSQMNVLREKWYHLDSPRHLYFLPQSLVSSLAREEGLEMLSATTNDRLGKVLDRMGWDAYVDSFVPVPGIRRIAKHTVSPLLARVYGSHREGSGAGYTMVMRRPSH